RPRRQFARLAFVQPAVRLARVGVDRGSGDDVRAVTLAVYSGPRRLALRDTAAWVADEEVQTAAASLRYEAGRAVARCLLEVAPVAGINVNRHEPGRRAHDDSDTSVRVFAPVRARIGLGHPLLAREEGRKRDGGPLRLRDEGNDAPAARQVDERSGQRVNVRC